MVNGAFRKHSDCFALVNCCPQNTQEELPWERFAFYILVPLTCAVKRGSAAIRSVSSVRVASYRVAHNTIFIAENNNGWSGRGGGGNVWAGWLVGNCGTDDRA